jgi:hypothetical protein
MPKQRNRIRSGKLSWRAAWGLLVIGLLLSLGIQPVLAQTYKFAVPESTANVYVNKDGTVSVEYTYVFQNSPNADPLDIVDVGMPTTSYDLSSVTATINGKDVSRIAKSQYVDPGVEIHLGSGTIQPGKTGELRVHIGKIERMLFNAKSEEAEPYASFQFQPNYYGSEFVSGKTNMTVTLYLPPGLKENEPRYFPPENWHGSKEPQSGYDQQDRVFYRWTDQNATSSDRYTFGSSFPARLVPAEVLLTEVPVSVDSGAWCPILFCLGFAGFMVFTIWAAITGDRKRKLQYLPPKVAVEGNGIKRGLTAVEAALLMQQPMDKILTMILFAVVKKGVATVISRDPMKLEIIDPLPTDMRTYETDFVKAMAFAKPAEQRRGLQTMMTELVKSVSEKMRGFSRKETMEYYQDIMNKAWQQVEQAQTPELKMQMFDDAMDWTMLDKRFDDHTRDVFGPRPIILPGWWGRYDPSIGRASLPGSLGPAVSTSGNRPPQGVSLPNLPGSDFAASMVTGMQSFASNVVGDVTSFTSGVTEKTNPVPKTTSSGSSRSGGGGGGRSCACACACAGCACACAGGGR